MKLLKRFLLRLYIFIFPLVLVAQEGANKVEMADAMRSNGKIYVVVAILASVFLGLAFYLLSLEKRVRKFEKDQDG